MFDRGYLNLGRWRGAPIRVHWSMPLGAVLFSGMRLAPAFWVGFFLLVLAHEVGHAVLISRFGHRVRSIDVTGFGGLCRWSGIASDYQRAVIAWGGVLAQGLLLVATLSVLLMVGAPTHRVGAELALVFVRTNLIVIGLNLLPFPPLDGAHAWTLFSHLWARWQGRQLLQRLRRPRHRPLATGRARAGRKRADRATTDPAAGPPGKNGACHPESQAEIADFLRQIGEEAGRARKADRSERDR